MENIKYSEQSSPVDASMVVLLLLSCFTKQSLKKSNFMFLLFSAIWVSIYSGASLFRALFYLISRGKLRNKSCKPECDGSFNMDWRIKYFIPSQKRGLKFTNIRQSMLKFKTHSSFHDLFRFWYV